MAPCRGQARRGRPLMSRQESKRPSCIKQINLRRGYSDDSRSVYQRMRYWRLSPYQRYVANVGRRIASKRCALKRTQRWLAAPPQQQESMIRELEDSLRSSLMSKAPPEDLIPGISQDREESTGAGNQPIIVHRRRGRPSKIQPSRDMEEEDAVRRKRGRPRKEKQHPVTPSTPPAMSRRRGRPLKTMRVVERSVSPAQTPHPTQPPGDEIYVATSRYRTRYSPKDMYDGRQLPLTPDTMTHDISDIESEAESWYTPDGMNPEPNVCDTPSPSTSSVQQSIEEFPDLRELINHGLRARSTGQGTANDAIRGLQSSGSGLHASRNLGHAPRTLTDRGVLDSQQVLQDEQTVQNLPRGNDAMNTTVAAVLASPSPDPLNNPSDAAYHFSHNLGSGYIRRDDFAGIGQLMMDAALVVSSNASRGQPGPVGHDDRDDRDLAAIDRFVMCLERKKMTILQRRRYNFRMTNSLHV
ncbi:hypothetical protein AB5N19_13989 [Seiridium cardinale]|uniref:Uncharacterized protein n=1 Tax=Seiridium cardinale TaxID=138064 RepID=A0ABR2XDK8_9PEZI